MNNNNKHVYINNILRKHFDEQNYTFFNNIDTPTHWEMEVANIMIDCKSANNYIINDKEIIIFNGNLEINNTFNIVYDLNKISLIASIKYMNERINYGLSIYEGLIINNILIDNKILKAVKIIEPIDYIICSIPDDMDRFIEKVIKNILNIKIELKKNNCFKKLNEININPLDINFKTFFAKYIITDYNLLSKNIKTQDLIKYKYEKVDYYINQINIKYNKNTYKFIVGEDIKQIDNNDIFNIKNIEYESYLTIVPRIYKKDNKIIIQIPEYNSFYTKIIYYLIKYEILNLNYKYIINILRIINNDINKELKYPIKDYLKDYLFQKSLSLSIN